MPSRCRGLYRQPTRVLLATSSLSALPEMNMFDRYRLPRAQTPILPIIQREVAKSNGSLDDADCCESLSIDRRKILRMADCRTGDWPEATDFREYIEIFSSVSSPPTMTNRVQSPAGSHPNFRKWESFRMMSMVGGFSRGGGGDRPFPQPFHAGAAP
ncbi:hypothetical protein PR048_000405 [Dryococelus australis]|uniref:Uncharacterized protein n=1 Tax=Dryococelus australis TaxID=614101 RepID=A0ABQ9IEI1_9NEOP|nr:hypothetical protein PR048_000405 [Dryococelus australis]